MEPDSLYERHSFIKLFEPFLEKLTTPLLVVSAYAVLFRVAFDRLKDAGSPQEVSKDNEFSPYSD